MFESFIPISQPSITQKEIEYVNDAVTSTWISSLGKYLDRFEEEFAAFCGTKYAITTANGTVAIHLALKALGIGEGDEVIVPDLSFIATANAVTYSGAKAVFVDIDPFNLCIDPNLIEAVITPKTKAIMPVHLYGHPADMIAINALAKKYNLWVIEDAAEAHGASIDGKKVGNWGFCGTFSFYGNKNLTTGEGGMITTNDEAFYQKCRYLRDHAMSKEKRYWHTELGYNYRMTNLQAALGVAQMERLDELMMQRKKIFRWYDQALECAKDYLRLNRTYPWAENAYWLVCAEFFNYQELERNQLMQALRARGIDSRPYFYPMSAMPYFTTADTPFTHKIAQQGINLPTYFDLTEDMVHRICESLVELVCVV
ncbi:MAG: DegT/DnrJ/EryC1/StrS family aminotransferase [Cyanothece sp. SIO1E1]|nr:DegT/DnrJ/EryC1/StrS family aminotransferase [Cyanothece sp. SIO1E1]